MPLAVWLCSNFGLDRCRQLRATLLKLPPTPLEAYAPLLAQEEDADNEMLATLGGFDAPLTPPLRTLYEIALTEHARDAPELWLRYAKRCVAHGDHNAAAAVGSRAMQALAEEHHADFVARYRAVATASGRSAAELGPLHAAKRRRIESIPGERAFLLCT